MSDPDGAGNAVPGEGARSLRCKLWVHLRTLSDLPSACGPSPTLGRPDLEEFVLPTVCCGYWADIPGNCQPKSSSPAPARAGPGALSPLTFMSSTVGVGTGTPASTTYRRPGAARGG